MHQFPQTLWELKNRFYYETDCGYYGLADQCFLRLNEGLRMGRVRDTCRRRESVIWTSVMCNVKYEACSDRKFAVSICLVLPPNQPTSVSLL